MGFCFLTRNYGGIVIVIGVVPLVLVLLVLLVLLRVRISHLPRCHQKRQVRRVASSSATARQMRVFYDFRLAKMTLCAQRGREEGGEKVDGSGRATAS